MEFTHLKVEGAEVEIETSTRTVWFSLSASMEEMDVFNVLADLCGEFNMADGVLKKNPTLLREMSRVFNEAANNLRIIEKSILPQMKKTIRAIEEYERAHPDES